MTRRDDGGIEVVKRVAESFDVPGELAPEQIAPLPLKFEAGSKSLRGPKTPR